MSASAPLKLKIQLYCGDEIALGPGKADLLDAINATGSIAAAARSLGMSYRRSWMLVDAMNRCWNNTVVATRPGRTRGGGAALTDFGREILDSYRALQRRVIKASAGPEMDLLTSAIRPSPTEPRTK